MLGRFEGKVVSAGITTYKKDGVDKPRFVVKIQCIPKPDQKDGEGKQVNPFVREFSTTYVEGDNQMYADEAFMRMGYMWTEENFADFSDISRWNPDAKFEAVIHEEDGVDKDGNPKKFEKVKSIWEVQSYEVKNALAQDQVVNIMAGLSLPQGKSAAMREKIKEKNGGKMPEPKPKTETAPAGQADNSFAADDIPF